MTSVACSCFLKQCELFWTKLFYWKTHIWKKKLRFLKHLKKNRITFPWEEVYTTHTFMGLTIWVLVLFFLLPANYVAFSKSLNIWICYFIWNWAVSWLPLKTIFNNLVHFNVVVSLFSCCYPVLLYFSNFRYAFLVSMLDGDSAS